MKSASDTGSTFNFYGTVMCFNNLSGDRKSEACAAGLIGYERFKYPRFLRWGHAASVILNRNMYILSSGFGTKTDASMCMADGFLSVAKKIQKYLSDFQGIQR